MKRQFDQVLQERARQLARPLRATSSQGETMLLFALGEERFATPLGSLREVVTTAVLTAVPGIPQPFIGLTNIRGALIAVLDVRRLLRIADPRPDGIHPILLAEDESGLIGVWADAVHGLIEIEVGALDTKRAQAFPGLWGRSADLTAVIRLDELIAAARLAAHSTNALFEV